MARKTNAKNQESTKSGKAPPGKPQRKTRPKQFSEAESSKGDRGRSKGTGGREGAKRHAPSYAAHRGEGVRKQHEESEQSQRARKMQASRANGASKSGNKPEKGSNQGGMLTRAMGTAKGHPAATAAIAAGAGLLLAQGVRVAMAARKRGRRGQSQKGESSEQKSEKGAKGHRSADDDEAGEEDEEEEEPADGVTGKHETEEGAGTEDSSDKDSSSPTGRLAAIGETAVSMGRSGLFRVAQAGSRVLSAMQSGVSSVGKAARNGAERGRELASHARQDYSLLIAGAALTAGMAAGFLLPATRQEDQLMGGLSDRLAGKLKKGAQELFTHGRESIERAFAEGIEAIAREVEHEGLTPERLARKFKRVATHARDAVAEAFHAVG